VLEPRVVSIGSDPLASRFDSERGEPGVRRQVTRGSRLTTERFEDPPMMLSRNNLRSVRLFQKDLREGKRILEPAWSGKYSWVCGDADNSREHLR